MNGGGVRDALATLLLRSGNSATRSPPPNTVLRHHRPSARQQADPPSRRLSVIARESRVLLSNRRAIPRPEQKHREGNFGSTTCTLLLRPTGGPKTQGGREIDQQDVLRHTSRARMAENIWASRPRLKHRSMNAPSRTRDQRQERHNLPWRDCDCGDGDCIFSKPPCAVSCAVCSPSFRHLARREIARTRVKGSAGQV